MGGSVAGQIRIDLLAEVAQFNAGMRTASQSLGSFQEQAAKVDRQLATMEAAPNYAQKQRDNWVNAMRGGGPLTKVDGALGGKPFDLALHNEVRWKNMIPWGNTARVELSREAALTAAAVAGQGRQIATSLRSALKDIGVAGLSGGSPGAVLMGGLRSMAEGAMAHPVAAVTIGGAAYAGYKIHGAAGDQAELARQARRDSRILGQDITDTSRLRAVGLDTMMLSRFQRSLADRSPGFQRLGLDAEALGAKPMVNAIAEVGSAFETIHNPVDRAQVAFQLFGRSGAEMLPVLENLRAKLKEVHPVELVSPEQGERIKAFDRDAKKASNAWKEVWVTLGKPFKGMGMEWEHQKEQLGTFLAHPVDAFTDRKHFATMQTRWSDEKDRIANADALNKAALAEGRMAESARLVAERKKEAAVAAKKLADELARGRASAQGILDATMGAWRNAMYGPGTTQEDEFRKHMRFEPNDRTEAGVQRMRQLRHETELGNEAQAAIKSQSTPEGRFDRAMEAANQWRKTHFATDDNLQTYWRIQRKAMEDYYRDKSGLESASLRDSLKTTTQQYLARGEWLRRMATERSGDGKTTLSGEEVAAIRRRDREDLRSQLGIKNPLEDFQRDIGSRYEAYRAGVINSRELATYIKGRREQTFNEMASGPGSVTPSAAMGVKSREEHAALTRSFLSDQATSQRKGVLEKLAKIEENTRNRPTETIQSIR